MTTLTPDQMMARHRERQACVYVRQLTPKQVQHYQESPRNRSALVHRALDLGWPASQGHGMDADLGPSGHDGQRPGFQARVAAVSLGQVGVILAHEAGRVARNNSDWHTRLDPATAVGTLMTDPEGVDDPRRDPDRPSLDWRGLRRAAELRVWHPRMEAGRQRRLARGAYRQPLPGRGPWGRRPRRESP
jgi:DNA invertase Pin-like site-specific DNA recombinase